MKRSLAASFLNGSLLGLAIGLGFLAFFGGFFALDTVDAVRTVEGTVAAEPQFVVDGSTLWILVLLLGAVGGLVIGAIVYAMGRATDPAAQAYPARYLMPVAAVLASVMAYSTIRLGVTIAGSLVSGTVMIGVAAFVVIVGVAGIVAGGTTAPIVDALARPANIGERNAATPASSKSFWMDLGGAIGVPTLSIVVIALLAISLAEVLLGSESSVVAITIFAGVGAAILGGTTLVALRPWERNGPGTDQRVP